MCLRRAPEKYIAGAALDRAGIDDWLDRIKGRNMREQKTKNKIT
jgi:hypothetical protein